MFSVVVPAYNARGRILPTLAAIAVQQFVEAYEVIVVDSGPDSPVPEVSAMYPHVRFVRSSTRLGPGAARNAGVRVARGTYIAFCPDDGLPSRRWLSARLAAHRAGHDAVGGSITNGTPRHLVGLAGYLLEYSAMLPTAAVLRRQEVPHALSFHRSVFERLGLYPEDTTTGEDTLYNRRCLAAGVSVGFAPDAAIAHRNPTGLREMLRHAFAHGAGLMQCVAFHGLGASIGPAQQGSTSAAWRMFVVYPVVGLRAKWQRLSEFAPEYRLRFLVVSPLVLLGLLATGLGAWEERRRLQRSRSVRRT